MNILILNGPNLNLLGTREISIYGKESLEDIQKWLIDQPEARGHKFIWYQSNHEGNLIDQIHIATDDMDGIIINPGALTHYSYTLRDAIAAINIPVVEVHLSNIHSREAFRKKSVIKDVCLKQIYGHGKRGYLEAIKALLEYK
ncbi:MAG: type II 3-dehydroquinate dehydratase [Fidelibacterota bacterium]